MKICIYIFSHLKLIKLKWNLKIFLKTITRLPCFLNRTTNSFSNLKLLIRKNIFKMPINQPKGSFKKKNNAIVAPQSSPFQLLSKKMKKSIQKIIYQLWLLNHLLCRRNKINLKVKTFLKIKISLTLPKSPI